MAKKQDTAQNQTNTFVKGLNKDSDPSFVTEGMWTHARNAVNNTAEGDLGTLSNERSNALCTKAGQTLTGLKYIIGLINLYSDYWIVFTAAHANKKNKKSIASEIGLFVESSCEYFPIVIDKAGLLPGGQDPYCLNFSRYNLISGAAREKEDCSWQVYWADGLNPDRYLNVGDPKTWPIKGYTWGGAANPNKYYLTSDLTQPPIQWPNVQWIEQCTKGDCEFCVDLPKINCDDIRLARLVETPCMELILGNSAGTLDNGSYFVSIAYTIKGQKVTDYYSPSNIQAVYTPNNSQGSLQLNITADYKNFDEFVLIIVGFINEGIVTKQLGYYSTRTSTIFIDQIKLNAVDADDFDIVKQTPVFEKSDQIVQLNNYLLRIGPTSKFDFNYQPLANLIRAEWVSVEYPSDYYFKGGNKTTYVRDEVYAFFIRWVYDTGDKSASYHIPGRPPKGFEISQYSDDNSLPNDTLLFETQNTATQTSILSQNLPDGGKVIAVGDMGYWQAETEIYPDNRPDIWNASYHPWTNLYGLPSTDYDLCGLPIRHHLFPDNDLTPETYHFQRDASDNSMKIRLMGIRFKNIATPVDNQGNIIKNIVGYEILKGSREGNKSIIAKGMLNNFKDYLIQGVTGNTRTGLYANFPYNCIYPSLNTGNTSDHNYGPNDPFIKKVDVAQNVYNQNVPREIVSFHSPDTSFRNPFLQTTELKLYGHVSGQAEQFFIEPAGHPKNKLLTNTDFWLMMMYALGYALLQSGGKKTINYPQGSFTQPWGLTVPPPVPPVGVPLNVAGATATGTANTTFTTALTAYYNTGGFIFDGIFANDTLDNIFRTHNNAILAAGGTYNGISYTTELSGSGQLPTWLKVLGGFQLFAFNFGQGLQTAQNFLYAIAPLRQYALQLIGHGYYDKFNPRISGQQYRYRLEDGFYVINDTNQEIPDYINTNTGAIRKYTIQNLLRPKLVVLRTSKASDGTTTGPRFLTSGTSISQQISNAEDKSSVTLGMADTLGLGPQLNETRKTAHFFTPIASHYAAIKVRLKNQYGQLQSIKQQAITPCEQKTDVYGTLIKDYDPSLLNTFYQPSVDTLATTQVQQLYYQKLISLTDVFFGGDTYICRFTEKNPMFLFYRWLYGEADDFEYNYFVNQMLPQARYWMNSQHYDVSAISVESLTDFLNITNNALPGAGLFPEDFYQLDNKCYRLTDDNANPAFCNAPGFLSPKEHYFYTSVSGVRDFYVETDILVDYREVGTFDFEKCYHPYRYTDLQALFKMDPIIPTRGNYYIYDLSLSASRLPNKFLTFGILQNRYYDPLVASLCYTYYPNVITYSLPNIPGSGSVEDNWFIFLPNNRKDFISQVSSVKNFARTGALITFKNDGPQVFQGVDQLQLDASGIKVTVGDGGLFLREPQNLVVTDKPYQYGSSQSRLAVISTPAGIYYMSQNQGKIFTYNEGITEISQSGMKWWFDEFLPSRLLEDFPQYDYADNPVAGIGCQAIYDNENAVLYFCKKDYKLKDGFNSNPLTPNRIQYVSTDKESYFIDTLNPIQINKRFDLGDPEYFEDASWTASYDPKNRFWISFHDWHPDLTLPTKSTIVTTRGDEFWSHNLACNDYCNFYGTQYPFEIEFPIVTGQTITTLKSVEYMLECYRRDNDYCVDQFHVLDYNFDYAVIHNTEQVSAYLKLNIYAKNNPPLNLEYPKLNTSILVDPSLQPFPGFDILFSKEENKYRFNQFWDSVRNRGEFPINPPQQNPQYPPTNPVIPGTTILSGTYIEENLWVTQSNGYIKTINYNNVSLNKSPLEHKKFRHYVNFIKLAKVNSRDTNMILKIFNTKNQYSPR